jgi:hypothetical protein
MGAHNTGSPVILVEYNELSPVLLERFMAEGRLPSFRRLYEQSHVHVSDADERAPNLEPWIQWVTVHSGMPFREHKVFHLAHAHELSAPFVWDVASAHGRKVWVCGSMNVRYDRPVHGLVLPDPWSRDVAPWPAELEAYHRFVQAHVLEYTSDRVPLGAVDCARFAAFMVRHGMSAASVRAVVRQLASERKSPVRHLRATILDKLQMDLFEHVYRRERPALSTFFLNSTAHFQHIYWRNMEPEKFTLKPTAEEQALYGNAIRHGYEQMDALLGRILDLAGREATVILCTALSQQACLTYEGRGGKAFARPRDVDALLSFAQIGGHPKVTPVMSQNFHLAFGDTADAVMAERRLRSLRLDGDRPAMNVERRGNDVHAGSVNVATIPDDAVMTAEDGRTVGYFEIFYRVEGMKSGMHHPDGALWVRRPNHHHAVFSKKVPLTAVAPTVLAAMGLPRPPTMRTPTLDELERETPPSRLRRPERESVPELQGPWSRRS